MLCFTKPYKVQQQRTKYKFGYLYMTYRGLTNNKNKNKSISSGILEDRHFRRTVTAFITFTIHPSLLAMTSTCLVKEQFMQWSASGPELHNILPSAQHMVEDPVQRLQPSLKCFLGQKHKQTDSHFSSMWTCNTLYPRIYQ